MKRSQETKTIIADRFKQLLSQKPLSKITIRELISDCAINRKTFYYHFEDIYALLKWTLEREVITVADQFDLLAETDEMVSFVLLYIEQNRALLKKYVSVRREGYAVPVLLQRYFEDCCQTLCAKARRCHGRGIQSVFTAILYRRHDLRFAQLDDGASGCG